MKSLFWALLLPFFLAVNSGMDLGVERTYVGFQAVPNSSSVCKLVLMLKVTNQGDVESPVCDLEFFAAPVREDSNFKSRETKEIPALAPGESIDLTKEWRVDKAQADQICKEMCCGMMLIKAGLHYRDTLPDINSRNNEIVSILLGKLPENHADISSLDSVLVKMKTEDKDVIIEELGAYNAVVLRMLKAGNSGCWVNQENGYASIVHLNR